MKINYVLGFWLYTIHGSKASRPQSLMNSEHKRRGIEQAGPVTRLDNCILTGVFA